MYSLIRLKKVKGKNKLIEREAREIFKQILEGVYALHSRRILHRDINLKNILIDENYESVKICNFGHCRILRRGEIIYDKVGSPAYLAPEIIAGKGYDEFSSDVWSLGILLYTLLTGSVPFKANNLKELQKQVLQGKYKIPDFISSEARDLISQMLEIVPYTRISVRKAIEHP